jgi:HAD superfamily phosphoserine phosphatase-like hydrolase
MDKKPRGLVTFDLDGTLLRGPTVCEVLAARLGRLQRMQHFETLTRPEDVESAREETAGWYRGIERSDLHSMLRDATPAPNAREAVELLRQHGFAVAIASITWEFAVAWFAEQFGISHYSGTGLLPDGRVVHEWPRDKPTRVVKLANDLGIPRERTAAVGDSAGDVPMLQAVRHPFFVGPRLPENLAHAMHLHNADMLTLANFLIERMACDDGEPTPLEAPTPRR